MSKAICFKCKQEVRSTDDDAMSLRIFAGEHGAWIGQSEHLWQITEPACEGSPSCRALLLADMKWVEALKRSRAHRKEMQAAQIARIEDSGGGAIAAV